MKSAKTVLCLLCFVTETKGKSTANECDYCIGGVKERTSQREMTKAVLSFRWESWSSRLWCNYLWKFPKENEITFTFVTSSIFWKRKRNWEFKHTFSQKGKGERPERWEIVKFLPCSWWVCMRVNVMTIIIRFECIGDDEKFIIFPWERFLLLQHHIALKYSHFLRVFNSEKKRNKK